MVSKTEVLLKYEQLFEEKKEYLAIVKETHQFLERYQDKAFALADFKNEIAYHENIGIIQQYRKYAQLDDLLLNSTEYALIPVADNQQNLGDITYREVMAALDLFENTIHDLFHFYLAKNVNFKSQMVLKKVFLTIKDVFHYQNESKYTLYTIESSSKRYFSVVEDGYEYVFELPFKENDMSEDSIDDKVLLGYIYLISEHVENEVKHLPKDKEYTTISIHFGRGYDEFLHISEEKSRYSIFHNTLKPFLIEEEVYHPKMKDGLSLDDADGFTLTNYEERKAKQRVDFFKYFSTVTIDKEAVRKYVEDTWIQREIIGKVYPIDFNFIGTKEEVERYREEIIEEKYEDILLNFDMYKQNGLIQNNPDQSKGLLDDYSPYVKEYLSTFETPRKDYNTFNDKRIDLDVSELFAIGLVESSFSKYSLHPFEHVNIRLNDDKVFSPGKKAVQVQLNLEKFIQQYNELKNEQVLQINYDWYLPYKQLNDFVDNHIRAFCKIRLVSGVRKEEFAVLRDVFRLQGEERKQILTHPLFIQDTGKYLIQSRNPYYFEIPVVISMQMDSKEFEKIKKGTHSVFKSRTIEELFRKEQEQFLLSERFLSKQEVLSTHNYDVVYTFNTNEKLNLHKGMKGKIISMDNGIVIEDELGNLHNESFRSVGKSGWKHASTVDHEKLTGRLKLEEKAFLENIRQPLLSADTTK